MTQNDSVLLELLAFKNINKSTNQRQLRNKNNAKGLI